MPVLLQITATIIVAVAVSSAAFFSVAAFESRLTPQTITPDEVDLSFSQIQLHDSVGHYRVDITLATNGTPLNAFELEAFFDPGRLTVNRIVQHESLCDGRMVIDEVIDTENGRLYTSCGTPNPFVSGSSGETIVSLDVMSLDGSLPVVSLGEQTGFYVHDGRGTLATLRYAPQGVAF